MKICLGSNLYRPLGKGGVEMYVSRSVNALADEHHVVVTMEPGTYLQPRREITSEGVVYRLADFSDTRIGKSFRTGSSLSLPPPLRSNHPPRLGEGRVRA